MEIESIEVLPGRTEVVALIVGQADSRKQLFAKRPNSKISADCPMLWRRKGNERGHYEISTLDLSNVGFKEIRLEAYVELEELSKAIHVEGLGVAVATFVQRLASIRSKLFKVIRTKEFGAKLDALIYTHHQALLNHGDPNILELAASIALNKCLERELILQEKARMSQALHSALLQEESKISKEYAHSGVELKSVLRKERQRAVAAGMSIDAGKALMKVAAQTALEAHSASEQRKYAKNLLKAFLKELLASSVLFGDRGKFLLETELKKAVHRHGSNIELIEERLLNLARVFLENSAKQLALKQERLRIAREMERVRWLNERIKIALKRPSAISEKALKAAVTRMTNSDTPLEEVQFVIDELVRKSLLPNQTGAGLSSIGGKRFERPSDPQHGFRQGKISKASPSTKLPFNSAMADKLVGLLNPAKSDE